MSEVGCQAWTRTTILLASEAAVLPLKPALVDSHCHIDRL